MILGEEIFVFDDIIDLESQTELINYFENNHEKWHFFKKDISHGDYHNHYDYTFPAWSIDSNVKSNINQNIIEIIKTIEINSLKKIGVDFLSNYRYKLSCYPPLNPYPSDEIIFRQIHNDKAIPHLVMVYYANDTEGSTTIFRNKLGGNNISNDIVEKQTITGDFTNVEKIITVPPKQGRVVIFDGILLHSPGWPKKENRYIINFNTIVKTKNKNII